MNNLPNSLPNILPNALSGGFGYLLDGLPAPAFAWSSSLQLLSGNGLLSMEVRETSVSNGLQNVGFVGGLLDEPTIVTHCGTNAGDMKSAYDQSGDGRTFAQATAAPQPRIYAGPGPGFNRWGAKSRPGPDFTVASGDYLSRSDGLGITGNPDLEVFVAFQLDTITASRYLFTLGVATGGQTIAFSIDDTYVLSYRYFDGNRLLDFGSGVVNFTSGVNIMHAYGVAGAQYDAREITVNGIVGSEISSTNPTNTPNLQNDGSQLGARGDGASQMDGGILAAIVYNTVLTASQRAKINNGLAAHYQ